MRAGDIYWVNLDPTIGDEIRKKRPDVVLNEGHKKHLRLAIVVPITGGSSRWDENPFFVSLNPDDMNGLQKTAVADCFQIRAISHERFVAKIGSISDNQLADIKRAITLILDIDPEHCE
ncbi:MAG: type II toxin-antitoxin system PemK/MazF family toxin [Deltaproteobacteria bacterium]